MHEMAGRFAKHQVAESQLRLRVEPSVVVQIESRKIRNGRHFQFPDAFSHAISTPLHQKAHCNNKIKNTWLTIMPFEVERLPWTPMIGKDVSW
tara:strand:+ start:200 stop:478 length:279 start_codon:yes stop_codon:yes gene_type:complete